jgi:hypothetical protein
LSFDLARSNAYIQIFNQERSFQVNFSVASAADKFVIGKDGTTSAYTFESMMMQEIIHAIATMTDGANHGRRAG